MTGRNNRSVTTTRGRGSRRRGTAGLVSKPELYGHEVHIARPEPSPITQQPWYPLVIQDDLTVSSNFASYDTAAIVGLIQTQLGLPAQAQTRLNFQIRQVEMWAIAGTGDTAAPRAELNINSLQPVVGNPTTPGNAEVTYPRLKQLTDLGNLSKAAVVSYKWPVAESHKALSNGALFNVCSYKTTVPYSFLRFHVLWNSAGPSATVS